MEILKVQLGAVPPLVIELIGTKVKFDEVKFKFKQLRFESTSLILTVMVFKTPAVVDCAEMVLIEGASSTEFTVRTKDFESVSTPSETTTVMVEVPCWLRAGAIDRLQFGAVPDFVIFALGTRVVLDEVTVIELVQFGDESASVNE